jgi:hypothetical protein
LNVQLSELVVTTLAVASTAAALESAIASTEHALDVAIASPALEIA